MFYKQPISALVVIHTVDGYFLLLERVKHNGYWQSVTGSRDNNETPIQTAKRELEEETGINVSYGILHDWQTNVTYPIMPEWRYRYAAKTHKNTEHWFSFCVPPLAEVFDWVSIQPHEHSNMGWFLAKTAMSKCFSASNQELIKKIAQKNSWFS